jgi:SPP1 family predicted phage head-tail adaptor
MRAGQLRHLVKLQSLSSGQDDIGQPTMVWTDVASLWANIRYMTGAEAIRAGAAASISKVSIQIRKRAGVVPTMRFLGADGVVYQIEAVLPDMQSRDRINVVCEVIA